MIISSTPTLCAADVPCSVGECHDDGICYNGDTEVPAYLYKINWMVKAPADQKATPNKNDKDEAVTYHVQIYPAVVPPFGYTPPIHMV